MTDFTLWVLIAVLLALMLGLSSIVLRFYQQRENQRSQRVMFEVQARAVSEQTAHFNKLVRLQQELMRELAEREVGEVPERSFPDPPGQAAEIDGDVTQDPASHVVREISHSLNTPLSQIEVALSLVGENRNLSAEDRGALARAATSVAVLKSFVQAFRIVSGGDMASELDGDEDLAELVRRASSLLGVPDDHVDLDLPAEFPHRATLVLAMLAPLIENAIEASPPDQVFVRGSTTAASITLTVDNAFEGDLDPRTFERGFSTKSDHEGLGLAVVGRLTRSVPGARLTHAAEGGRVAFQITLPRRTRRIS